MRMVILEVLLGCPNFLPPAISGVIPKKARGSEPSAQEKSLAKKEAQGLFVVFYDAGP